MADPHQVLLQVIKLNHFKDVEKLIRCMRHGKSKDLEVLLRANLTTLMAQGVSFDEDISAIIKSITELCPNPTALNGASMRKV